MKQTIESTKAYCLQNIAPAMGTMLVFVVGAFLVYKGFYSGTVQSAAYAGMEPAAGAEMAPEQDSYNVPVSLDHIPVWEGEEQHTH